MHFKSLSGSILSRHALVKTYVNLAHDDIYCIMNLTNTFAPHAAILDWSPVIMVTLMTVIPELIPLILRRIENASLVVY